MSDPTLELIRQSIRWRTSAGWVVVSVMIWRYLAHPMLSAYLILIGQDPLPPLNDLALSDAATIIGLPIGGAFADRMTDDV